MNSLIKERKPSGENDKEVNDITPSKYSIDFI